jgi:hypothetical protein
MALTRFRGSIIEEHSTVQAVKYIFKSDFWETQRKIKMSNYRASQHICLCPVINISQTDVFRIKNTLINYLGIPQRRPGFNRKSSYVWFVVHKLTLWQHSPRVLRFPLPILIPPNNAPYSSVDHGWYNTPSNGRRTKWTQVSPHFTRIKNKTTMKQSI